MFPNNGDYYNNGVRDFQNMDANTQRAIVEFYNYLYCNMANQMHCFMANLIYGNQSTGQAAMDHVVQNQLPMNVAEQQPMMNFPQNVTESSDDSQDLNNSTEDQADAPVIKNEDDEDAEQDGEEATSGAEGEACASARPLLVTDIDREIAQKLNDLQLSMLLSKEDPDDVKNIEKRWKDLAAVNKELNGGKSMECAFCKKNGEKSIVFSSHRTKDNNGKVTCPILASLVCEFCGSTGENAHTKRHCKFNKNASPQQRSYRVLSNGVRSFQLNHK